MVATGPFASHSRRAWAPGAALVGDAADFFDPFTGEGIYAALRGGELLADALVEGARRATTAARRRSRAYDRARRNEFGGKWIVERVIGAVVGCAAAHQSRGQRLSARKDLADLLIGVTGNFVPAERDRPVVVCLEGLRRLERMRLGHISQRPRPLRLRRHDSSRHATRRAPTTG